MVKKRTDESLKGCSVLNPFQKMRMCSQRSCFTVKRSGQWEEVLFQRKRNAAQARPERDRGSLSRCVVNGLRASVYRTQRTQRTQLTLQASVHRFRREDPEDPAGRAPSHQANAQRSLDGPRPPVLQRPVKAADWTQNSEPGTPFDFSTLLSEAAKQFGVFSSL